MGLPAVEPEQLGGKNKRGTPGGSRTITITVQVPKCTPPACADTSSGQAAMSPGLRTPPACSFSREKGGLEQDRTEESHLYLRSGADECHNGLRAQLPRHLLQKWETR